MICLSGRLRNLTANWDASATNGELILIGNMFFARYVYGNKPYGTDDILAGDMEDDTSVGCFDERRENQTCIVGERIDDSRRTCVAESFPCSIGKAETEIY